MPKHHARRNPLQTIHTGKGEVARINTIIDTGFKLSVEESQIFTVLPSIAIQEVMRETDEAFDRFSDKINQTVNEIDIELAMLEVRHQTGSKER